MGYYTGSGVTSGGSSTVSPFQTYMWAGFHTVYQKTTSVTNQKAGVSLATAQGQSGECNLSSHQFQSGSSWYTALNCKGTKRQVNYSRINDSNLYVLTVTNDTIQAKLDNGSWVS